MGCRCLLRLRLVRSVLVAERPLSRVFTVRAEFVFDDAAAGAGAEQ